MINTHKDHPDGDELIRKSDIYDILDNDYLVADRKEERLRGLRGIEPKRGEWVRYMGDIWTCSACGEGLICDDIECNNFCPNCGADMRGGDNK